MVAATLPRTTLVELDNGGSGFVLIEWGDFLDTNVDSIGPDEEAHIALTLSEGFTYQGGDGAEARWTVKAVPS